MVHSSLSTLGYESSKSLALLTFDQLCGVGRAHRVLRAEACDWRIGHHCGADAFVATERAARLAKSSRARRVGRRDQRKHAAIRRDAAHVQHGKSCRFGKESRVVITDLWCTLDYVRQLPNAIRSNHPMYSFTGAINVGQTKTSFDFTFCHSSWTARQSHLWQARIVTSFWRKHAVGGVGSRTQRQSAVAGRWFFQLHPLALCRGAGVERHDACSESQLCSTAVRSPLCSHV